MKITKLNRALLLLLILLVVWLIAVTIVFKTSNITSLYIACAITCIIFVVALAIWLNKKE